MRQKVLLLLSQQEEVKSKGHLDLTCTYNLNSSHFTVPIDLLPFLEVWQLEKPIAVILYWEGISIWAAHCKDQELWHTKSSPGNKNWSNFENIRPISHIYNWKIWKDKCPVTEEKVFPAMEESTVLRLFRIRTPRIGPFSILKINGIGHHQSCCSWQCLFSNRMVFNWVS